MKLSHAMRSHTLRQVLRKEPCKDLVGLGTEALKRVGGRGRGLPALDSVAGACPYKAEHAAAGVQQRQSKSQQLYSRRGTACRTHATPLHCWAVPFSARCVAYVRWPWHTEPDECLIPPRVSGCQAMAGHAQDELAQLEQLQRHMLSHVPCRSERPQAGECDELAEFMSTYIDAVQRLATSIELQMSQASHDP
eukprot:363267-Chlamydomonas_euryale.AAC.5